MTKSAAQVAVHHAGDEPSVRRLAARLEAAFGAPGECAPGERAPEETREAASADVILCLDPVSLSRRGLVDDAPLCVACIPTFDAAPWSPELARADLVLVPHQAMVGDMLLAGFPRARVVVVGPLPFLSPDEATAPDRRARRAELGLPQDQKVVVVDARALADRDLPKRLVQLSLVRQRTSWLFDVGEDAELARTLRSRVSGYGIDAWMFAGGGEADRYWAAADAAVADLGSMAAIRALVSAIGLVALPPAEGLARLAPQLEAASLVAVADAEATLAVTIDGGLTEDALLQQARAMSALEPSESISRVQQAVVALHEQRASGHVPSGLPKGLERLGEADERLAASEADRGKPSRSDLDARVERELDALRQKHGLR